MSERKNIDRLFQEGFKDFEAEPSEISWEKIEARLEEKEDRKVIPFWFKLTGVAAILLIGLFLTFNYGSDKEGNGGQQVTVGADKNQGETNKNGSGPAVKIDRDTFGKQDNAVVSSEGKQPNAVIANPAQNKGQNAATGLVNEGSNASGIRQADNGVAVYPSQSGQKKSKAGKNPGVSGNSVAPSLENGEEQYASADKAKKARKKRNPSGDGQYPPQESQVAQDQNSLGNKGKSTIKNQQSQIAENGISNGKNKSGVNKNGSPIAQNSDASDKKGTSEFSTNEKIAVNENNQSGKTQQHNNAQVTEKTTTSTQAIAAKTDDIKKDSTGIATVEEPNALEELLKNEKENKSVTQNEPKINRWQITSKVAPIYSSSASSGSPIDSRFAQNDKEYKTKLSYGMGVSYALNKRLSVRAGVNTLAFETNTRGVVAEQSTVGRQQLQHVKPTLQGAFLKIDNKSTSGMPELGSNGMTIKEFNSSISQKTGYLEVPLELSYKVLDKRFGVDVIGGFSTLFLNENKVSVVTSSSEMQVGKASNLNNTSFSGNLGLGVRYNILKALQVNVEPMFKYQFNTYTEAGNFKPYFFGIYTGLNYRF